MVSGLAEAAQYDAAKGVLPGRVRSYWDTFGIGLAMAIALIVIGSLWSVFAGMRARRAEAQ
jgi:Na+-translocating ferredoxin:NAD+ oxidoreductase RnfE subunit